MNRLERENRADFLEADRELLRTFESLQIPAGGLAHKLHVRLAWLYLRLDSVLVVLEEIARRFQQFAAKQGKPELYHATMTWAYILLIHERMQREPGVGTFEDFCRKNPDLLEPGIASVKRLYSAKTLESPFARQCFVMPDNTVC